MIYSIVAVLVLVLDQAVKFWTTKNIIPQAIGSETVKLIPGVVHMTNVQNTGAAFSILADMRWLLVGVSVLFIIGIIVLISSEIIHTKFGRWTAILVMAGALGNCIDRVLYGYVVDMFEVELFTFAVFNVADIFITVCGLLFCIHVILYREPAEVAAAAPAKPSKPGIFKRAKAAPAEEDEEDLYDDEPAPARTVKGKRTKAAKTKEDPYANIPRRGQHRSLEEELRIQNPDDPFAEWGFGEEVSAPAPRRTRQAPEEEPVQRPARRTRPAAEEEPAPARPARRKRPAPVEEDEDVYEQAAPARRKRQPAEEEEPAPARPARRKRPAPVEEDEDLYEEPAPARRPAPKTAPAKPAAAAPAKKPVQQEPGYDLDAGFDDYSLEDILSEFRDI